MKKGTHNIILKYLFITLCNILFIKNGFSQKSLQDCFCKDNFHSTSNYLPLLEDLNCNGIETSLFALKTNKLKGLFYSNEQNSQNNCSFDLITYKKFEIVLPNTYGLKLILNPCINKGSVIPFEIDYEHDLNKCFPNLDYKAFSKKPKDYYYMLVQMSEYNDKKYYNFLRQTKNIISGEDAPSEKFMFDVRKLFPELKNLNQNFKGEQDFIEEFAESIGSCKTNHPVEWVWETLLQKHLNPKDSMELTEALQRDFTLLFEKRLGPFNLESFNKMIYPQVKTTVHLKKSSIIFPSTILRKWDVKNQKSFVNDSNTFISSEMLFDLEKIISKDNNQKISIIDFKNPCMASSEISGTGIIIQPDSLISLFHAKQDVWLPYTGREFFETGFVKFISDSVIKKLQGILLWSVNVQLPIIQNNKTNHINCKGSDFILNGKNIYGALTIKVTKSKNGLFEIKTDKKHFTFSLNDLKHSLEVSNNLKYEINISPIKTENSTKSNNQTITIYFKYDS